MKLRRVVIIAVKEWREMVRDRLFLSLAFAMPVIWMLVFGYTMVFDVQNAPFAVVDLDHSSQSRDLVYRFASSRYFDFRGYLTDQRQAARLLTEAKLRLVLTIPPHFGRDVMTGRRAEVATALDGTFPNRAQTIQAYAQSIIGAYNDSLRARYMAAKLGIDDSRARLLTQPVRLQIRYLYNQALRSIWSVAPSLVMLTLMFVPTLLTALVVVREKETGSIYNIYCSTVTPAEFIAGKMLPSIAVAFVDGLILTALAVYWFGAPFKGAVGFYLLALLVYVVSTASIGLAVSTLVRSQYAALMIASIVGIVPAIQFSGMVVPISNLSSSGWVQAHVFPAMYFENVALGSFLKGVGGSVLWTNVCVLAGYAAVLIAVSLRAFRKRVAR